MSLSDLSRRAAELSRQSKPDRLAGAEQLLPELDRLADDTRVGVDTRLRVVTTVLRAVAGPGTARPATPAEGVALIRAALEQATSGQRLRGRPAIGPATTVRFAQETYDWLEEQAEALGLLDKQGRPKLGATIRHFVEQAHLADQRHSRS